MNTIVIIVSFVFLAAYDGFAKIRNGYGRRIEAARSALHTIKLRLADTKGLSLDERQTLERDMQGLVSYVSCYELTEELIARLRKISPSIFWDIENITDKKGRPTDVYVKLVPDHLTTVNLKAASFVKQVTDDADASCSEHGTLTVSIEVCIRDNSLFMLCHELGHMKYIIPNLAAYNIFYQNVYGRAKYYNLPYIGHNHRDKSGLMAREFEKIHRKDMMSYKENLGGELRNFVSLFSRLKKIQASVHTDDVDVIANVF